MVAIIDKSYRKYELYVFFYFWNYGCFFCFLSYILIYLGRIKGLEAGVFEGEELVFNKGFSEGKERGGEEI